MRQIFEQAGSSVPGTGAIHDGGVSLMQDALGTNEHLAPRTPTPLPLKTLITGAQSRGRNLELRC